MNSINETRRNATANFDFSCNLLVKNFHANCINYFLSQINLFKR